MRFGSKRVGLSMRQEVRSSSNRYRNGGPPNPTKRASRRHQLGQRASIGSFRGEHVVGRQRAPDPFERKLTNRFYRDRIFDRREDTGTD